MSWTSNLCIQHVKEYLVTIIILHDCIFQTMSSKSSTRVKFQDQQLDDYLLENSVLKSKLQSKMDALSIMNKELDKCSMERDRFKVLVEQLKLNRALQNQSTRTSNYLYRLSPTNSINGGNMLAETKDHNNLLKLEVETLQSRLEEATGDILALRKQLHRMDALEDINGSWKTSTAPCSNPDYEQLVQELEKIQKKYQQIQLDYRATLDEKEELVSDRDYYKDKVQRLNHQISYILSNRVKTSQVDKDMDVPKSVIDIDALVTENKYLQERITQLQVEKEIVKRTLTKYKTLLDNRKRNETLNLKNGFADVMTQKQVREFLDINSKTGLKWTSAVELKSLCLGLFEALNDKSIALQHQRKTNQILANRITELEKTLDSWCSGQKYIPEFPSQMLLDEFLPDTSSVKEYREKLNDNTDNITNVSKDSDSEEDNKNHSDGSSDRRSSDGYGYADRSITTKIVLPFELEQLVKEALAEMKPVNTK